MLDCTCDDWKRNVPYINTALFQLANHGANPYSGKPFMFCPWCATRILRDDGWPIIDTAQGGDTIQVRNHD